jgi:hypothetical protein
MRCTRLLSLRLDPAEDPSRQAGRDQISITFGCGEGASSATAGGFAHEKRPDERARFAQTFTVQTLCFAHRPSRNCCSANERRRLGSRSFVQPFPIFSPHFPVLKASAVPGIFVVPFLRQFLRVPF